MAEVANQPIKEAPATNTISTEPSTMNTEAALAAPPLSTEAMASEIVPEPANNLSGPTPAETEPMQPTEEQVANDVVKIEAQPASEGILGYKAPGLIRSFRFSKRYFWFSDEPVESKSLSPYLRDEKPEVGHHNAAYATQTGRGLLFFVKRVEDKSQPAGILHLGDASDVAKEGASDFSFKLHGQKHTFQANSGPERDSWIVAVESKATDAKASLDEVKNSEGYKTSKKSFAGTAVAIGGTAGTAKSAVIPSKSTGTMDKAVETPAEVTGENTAVAPAAEKKTEKARSQSRKRQSIFGKFAAKKDEVEEKREIKKEEKAEKKAEKAEEKAEAKEEKQEEKAEKKAEKEMEQEAKEDEATDPIVNGETTKTGNVAPAASKSSKRNSVFGSFFNRKETPKELTPAVMAKDLDTAPATAVAPQIEEPAALKSEEPMMNIAAPTEAVTETPAVSTPAGETAAVKTTATTPDTKEKRRQSFFNLGGKKEKRSEGTSDSEGAEKSGSATAKLGNVFRRASRSAKPTNSMVTDSGVPPPISKDTTATNEPVAAEPIATEVNPAATETTMNESTLGTVSASA